MSIRSQMLLLLSFAALAACDDLSLDARGDEDVPLEAPTAPVVEDAHDLVRVERACIEPLVHAEDKHLDALLSVDLADVEHAPESLRVRAADDTWMHLSDDGLDGDASAGDLRYSLAVSGGQRARASMTCAAGDELDLDVEPVFPLISADPPGVAKVGGGQCREYPESQADCTICGGQWRPFYRCYGWPWYTCEFEGYRCYGW